MCAHQKLLIACTPIWPKAIKFGGDLINIYKALSPQEFVNLKSFLPVPDVFNMMKSDRQINARRRCVYLQGREKALWDADEN